MYDLICIGGGAAGFFAAISSAELSKSKLKIAILEATHRPLTKVKISGGGRCNVTHDCKMPKELIGNYPRGGKSLLNGFFKFGPVQMLEWLHLNGIDTIVEKDGRIFPASQSSQTIIDCFLSKISSLNIDLHKGKLVRDVTANDTTFIVHTQKDAFETKCLVLATGGMIQGHELARKLGHSITELAPSLFTLSSNHPLIEGNAGLSSQNVKLRLEVNGQNFDLKGPILITHWGFSGPAVLKLSSFAARELHKSHYEGVLKINWLPDIKFEELLTVFKTQKTAHAKKYMKNLNPTTIPNRLWERVLSMTEINESKWADVKDKTLRELAQIIQNMECSFSGKGEFKEEFVTCGGVDLNEIHLKSFESKIHPRLYFCGELLDVDGITGGFNFQNAWTSARMAATSIVSGLGGED